MESQMDYCYHICNNDSISTEEMKRTHVTYVDLNLCFPNGMFISAERKDKLLCAFAGDIVGRVFFSFLKRLIYKLRKFIPYLHHKVVQEFQLVVFVLIKPTLDELFIFVFAHYNKM